VGYIGLLDHPWQSTPSRPDTTSVSGPSQFFSSDHFEFRRFARFFVARALLAQDGPEICADTPFPELSIR